MKRVDSCQNGCCAVNFSDKDDSPRDFFSSLKDFVIPILGFVFLLLLISFRWLEIDIIPIDTYFFLYLLLYLFISKTVLYKAFRLLLKGKIYNEFVLMTVATIGAFFIGSYAEGVAVMLFYIVGEQFQENAVNRAKQSIEALLKVQAEEVIVKENTKWVVKHPKEVMVGQVIQVRPGEKIALDGVLISEKANVDSSALTGESLPVKKMAGEEILAGMINQNHLIEIEVSSKFEDTKLANILQMVQDAVGRKAKTQVLISKLAKIYTPIVFWLAFALVLLPALFLGSAYDFQTWFQRALIFLVISCPCALVISIPLGYFGGIGAASANGILFKGSNYIDIITKVDTVVFDKTGTMTEGVFRVQDFYVENSFDRQTVLNNVALIEKNSTHPIALAIVNYAEIDSQDAITIKDFHELAGFGLTAKLDGCEFVIGNFKLLDKMSISYPHDFSEIQTTVIAVAVDGVFAGYFSIADALKPDAIQAINDLRKQKHIKSLIMLSGDRKSVVSRISSTLGIDKGLGELLPQDKMEVVQNLKQKGNTVAFVGDGINDAPVITSSDIGIAMGGLGSDAAIETADVVIQTDQPSKINTAIKIGLYTRKVIFQNIALAIGVKLLVLILGSLGLANLWEAVIADVGVALLAILNSVRIMRAFRY
ncbi:MAG: heavy metal translocating P-type ATPase [Bacteroidales bacterium]